MVDVMGGEYQIKTDRKLMDIDLIHQFISNSYWAKGIPKQTLIRSLDNSLCFGVFIDDQQVGFARVVTDKATFAYLADVFVLKEHRGRQLAKKMINEVLDHPELQRLRRIMLATQDAHELYRQFGFASLSNPNSIMAVVKPDIYQQ
jgi:GNAT superfamily N-acetyltransferase